MFYEFLFTFKHFTTYTASKELFQKWFLIPRYISNRFTFHLKIFQLHSYAEFKPLSERAALCTRPIVHMLLVSFMSYSVHLQISNKSESFITNLTDVWIFSSMGSHMSCQATTISK